MKPNRKHVRAVARATGQSRRAARRSLRVLAAEGYWTSSVHNNRHTGLTHLRLIRATNALDAAILRLRRGPGGQRPRHAAILLTHGQHL